MSNPRIAATVSEELKLALQEASKDLNTSESEIIRIALRDGLTEGVDGEPELDLPEWVEIPIKREQMKRRHKHETLASKFRKRAYDRAVAEFEDGLSEDEINVARMHYHDEAELYFDGEELEEKRAYIDAVFDQAIEATKTSDFDALDPEGMFSQYSGVKRGESRSRVEESGSDQEIIQSIRDRFDRARRKGNSLDTEHLSRAISNEHEISEEHASELIEEVRSEPSTSSRPSGIDRPASTDGGTEGDR
jgi:hypothetical protein